MSESIFDTAAFRSLVEDGAQSLGVPLTGAMLDDLARLTAWLLEWNERMNLTAVRQPEDVAVKHVLDSLTCLSAHAFPAEARVLDVGTGAGFPGLVLKIARPDLRLTLLDSTRKKLGFVEFVIAQMGWTGARAIFGRAEEIAHDPEQRAAYDVVVARAVAAMRVLCEFCLPFARVGGVFLAMKGPSVDAEMAPALSAIRRLGGKPGEVLPFSLPFGGGERAVVVIDKVAPTPEGFPRLYRDIKRQPL